MSQQQQHETPVLPEVPQVCPKCKVAAGWELGPQEASVRGAALWRCVNCGCSVVVVPDETALRVTPPTTDFQKIAASAIAGGGQHVVFTGRVVLRFDGDQCLAVLLVNEGMIIIYPETWADEIDLAKSVGVEGIVSKPAQMFGPAGWTRHPLIVQARVTQAEQSEEKT